MKTFIRIPMHVTDLNVKVLECKRDCDVIVDVCNMSDETKGW